MKTAIQLSIPKPCSKKWENFEATANGSYCNSCQKNVIDFTRASNEQIILFLSEHPNTCGRFRERQLTIYSELPQTKITPGFMLLRAGAIGALLFFFSSPASAQIIQEKVKTEEVARPKKSEGVLMNVKEIEHQVKGAVASKEDGAPLPGVNVWLQNSEIGTVTDAQGQFEFPRKLKEGDVLLFSFIGMMTEEFKVPKQIKGSLDIKMDCEFVTLGEVAVNEIYSPKQTGFKKLWDKAKALF
jgi:hypothetical protein